jgi:hypothetical protein
MASRWSSRVEVSAAIPTAFRVRQKIAHHPSDPEAPGPPVLEHDKLEAIEVE